ncbi:hypothetical protein TcarDRAFT_2109 [Thermosinus carboxydivorans Nor1]|uniref:Uncharacterized protein n=1 Tax=Thermosinus carboxydivorans Nor1 TaxID=401526 RepID=A1HN07_9FIRM|nr:hypothetical protein [Thermosinus carboxydivorans]EAX48637.1 hypothetical protein TcarDRAFT_2109 [Thermosinus carboxydivorans Nor1]
MLTGITVTLVVLLFFVFFVVTKKDMLQKLFSLNTAAPAQEFQQQLEQTADHIIRRLETQIAHLEYLLEEADAKMTALDQKIQAAAAVFEQLGISGTSLAEQATPNEQNIGIVQDTGNKPENIPYSQETGNDKRRLIFAMAEQGYNITEIAKATGIGKGEVMLILQLNKR